MRLRLLLKTTALTALLIIAGKVGWGQITSAQSGLWNATTTWVGGVVPTATDAVIIADGHTVTINTTPITVASLTVGQGTSGILTFDATTGRALTITGDVTVASGGKFLVYPIYFPTGDVTNGSTVIANVSSTAGLSTGMTITGTGIPASTTISAFDASTITLSAAATATGTAVALTINAVTITNTIAIGGNLTNNGVFDMSLGTTTAVCNATFNKAGDQTISGAGTITRFRLITLSKTSVNNKILCSTNVSIAGSSAITYTAGTWEQTANTLSFTSGSQNIASANGALVISGSGNLDMAIAGSIAVTGKLEVNTTGTFRMGSGNNSITTAGTPTLNFIAGNVTIYGRLTLTLGTTTISGANIFIDGQATTALSATSNIFEASGAATLNFSSGSITIVDPISAPTTGLAIKIAPSTGSFNQTGGTFYIGDGISTTTGTGGYTISSTATIKNLTLQTGGATLRDVYVAAASSLNIGGTLTLTSGKLTVGTGTLTLNNPLAGTTTNLLADNTSSIIIAGTVAGVNVPSSITALNNLTLNNTSGSTLTGNLSIANLLTLTSGSLNIGNYGLTLQKPIAGTAANLLGGATSSITIAGSTAGINIPTSITVLKDLTINNTNGTTLAANLEIDGAFTMISGPIVLGGNTLSYGASASLVYAGTSTQTTGVECLATLPNLTINNTNGVALGSSTVVSGALTFTNGKLTLGANNLTIPSTGTIAGAGASKYIVTSGAGYLKMNTMGGATVTYPVGPSATSYTPFVMNGNTIDDNLSVNVRPLSSHATLSDSKCVNLEWLFTEDVVGGNSGTVTFQWNTGDQGGTFDPAGDVMLGAWNGTKYDPNYVTVVGSGPYTVTVSNTAVPSYQMVIGNPEAFLPPAPALTAATTNNDVEHDFDITYTVDDTWKAAINQVRVNGTALNGTDWDKSVSGVITIKPTVGNTLLTTAGTKTIAVVATGYANSTVSQVINAGVFDKDHSTVTINSPLAPSGTSIITFTSKDQYDNAVVGYTAKFNVNIVSTGLDETYSVQENSSSPVNYSTSTTGISLPTTASQATITVVMPADIDNIGDGISIQVTTAGGASIGTAKSYTEAGTPLANLGLSTGSLSEHSLNGTVLGLALSKTTFTDATLDNSNFVLNNAPAGLTATVAYVDTKHATLTLAYTDAGNDFDVDVTNFSVKILAAELATAADLTSNDITLVALNEVIPVLTTNASVTSITYKSATCGGDVTADGGEAVTEKGICWGTATAPTTALTTKTTEGAGIGAITGSMSGLSGNTLYYVRAYATNSVGTNYGDERTFTTDPTPTLTLNALGATTYYAGDVVPLTWTSTGVTNVKIELFNGTAYSELIASTPSDGAESVTIPSATPWGTAYKIRISNVDDAAINSQSATAFTVKAVTSSLIDLQSMPANAVVKYIGKATVTYARPATTTGRGQKYIQDATAAVLIDDPTYFISGTYNVGDGITNIEAKVLYYFGIVEFTPTAATGATCTGNPVITPEVRTMASLTLADQSKLIKVMNFTFTSGTGNFAASQSYAIDDATVRDTTYFLRTSFAEANYITTTTAIPTAPVNSTALLGIYKKTSSSKLAMQIIPRNLADIQFTGATVTSTVYTVTATDITNIPFSTTLAEFKANLTPATGAAFEVYQSDGTTVATAMATGNKVIVTAQDGVHTKTYTITMNAISSDKDILTFKFGAFIGTITGTNIAVEVGSSLDVTTLVATFTLSGGAKATVGGVAQVSGTTANNFTNPVTYKITAEDASTKEYIVTVTKASAAATDLFFSEYVEGASNNKAFEIYNPGTTAVDLNGYTVKLSNNGAGFGKWAGTSGVPPYTGGGDDARYVLTFPVGTMIQPGDVYVVYNSAAVAGITAVGDLSLVNSQTANTPAGANVASFNGNDALALYKGTTLIDVFGTETLTGTVTTDTPAFDVAGTISAGKDHTIVRKSTVHAGNINWATSAGTDAATSEWIVYASDTYTYLGSHTMDPITSGPSLTVNPATLTSFGSVAVNTSSAAEKSFTVIGSGLTADIVITAPAGFEISKVSGIQFANESPITLTRTLGAVAETPIYVKFHPTAGQAYSANITITSTGATDKTVAVSGTGNATGISENWDSNLSIFPNPFTREIRFEGVQNVSRVIVTSITGQVVRNIAVDRQVNSIDTQDLPKGMYIVTFMNDKGEKAIRKMTKQ